MMPLSQLFNFCKEMIKNDESVFIQRSGITEGGLKYMIFDHYMCKFKTWEEYPEAKEMRGIMFEVSDLDIEKAEFVDILARPMKKFFNWGENPFSTFPINQEDILSVYDKADGSIVTSYLDGDGVIRFKSRFSISSEQAINATNLLYTDKFKETLDILTDLHSYGFCADLEYVSPNNSIVLNYREDDLIFHNSRNMETGELKFFKEEITPLIEDSSFKLLFSNEETIESTWNKLIDLKSELTGVEGYVVNLTGGRRIKVKTNWYSYLHQVKDSVNSSRHLWKNVMEGNADDVRALYGNNPDMKETLDRIDRFEDRYIQIVNKARKLFYKVYENSKNLTTKKDVAISSKEMTKDVPIVFNMFMLCYDKNDYNFENVKDYLNTHLYRYYEIYTNDL